MSGPALEGAAPAAQPPGFLRKLMQSRAVRSAAVEVAGFGGGQVIRLVSNLILTRLLFPAAFGVMAMLSVVYVGLVMLSDVGIVQATIRSPRGDDPAFLDTAWTIHAVRGVVLWLVACILAWPAAVLFKEPMLVKLLPAGALASVLYGAQSTRVLSLRRALRPLPVVTLETGSQIVSVVAMVALAWAGMGIWSLVVGNLLAGLVSTAGSFFLPGTHRERFRVDPSARKEIAHFGQWIYFSSIVSFLAGRGDQLLLGRLLGATGLGLYNLGLALAEMPEALANRVMSGVLYPLYARLHNTSQERFAHDYYRTRLAFDAAVHTALGGLIATAPWVIRLLYDHRYQGAAPLLQVVAIRTSLSLVATPCETALTSWGLSKYGFRRNLAVAVATFAFMPIGYHLGGTVGVIWATTFARLPALATIWPAARRHGFLWLRREALVPVFVVVGLVMGKLLVWVLPVLPLR